MPPRLIYLLSPKELSPETIAVAFAKTSRSPESFRQIAAELSDESSAKFHEKWVVGYGHASVAEHAVLHIAIENISRLAVECLESNRLASFTEKSTRYQKWDADHFFVPPELDGHPLREIYFPTCKNLFDVYTQSLAPLCAQAEKHNPRRDHETGEAYDRRIRSQYVDACRFLLPAASLANLGLTANARVLEHAICKMLSHPLAEVRAIGEEVKRVAQAEAPTLVKYAENLPYLTETADDFERTRRTPKSSRSTSGVRSLLTSDIARRPREAPPKGAKSSDSGIPHDDWCRLIDFDPLGEAKILAAARYHFGGMSYAEALETVTSASPEERQKLAEMLLGRLGPHDAPRRELEHTAYTFDLTLDQGGYAEFKRHRMMTQTPQGLTARLGYAVPRRIVEAGFEVPYRAAMDAAAEAYEKLSEWNPHVAAYVVPNGFNRRVLFTMNLREAFAFCQLRSAANAHFSMRRVAQRVAEEIRRVHPLLTKYLDLPQESWQEIEAQYFTQT